MSDPKLEDEFHQAMLSICAQIRENRYPPDIFQGMIERDGGWETAKSLLREPQSKGAEKALRALQRRGCLGISMEALVMQQRWRPLFTAEEREIARKRLVSLLSEPLGW